MLGSILTKVKSSIHIKLFLICLLISTVPILVFSIVTYHFTANRIEEDFKEYRISLGQQVINNLDDNIGDLIHQTMGMYAYEDDLRIILSSPLNNYDTIYTSAFNSLYERLNLFLQANSNIYGVTFTDKDGHIRLHLDRQHGDIKDYNVSDMSWFKNAIALNGKYILLEPHENTFTYKDISKQDVISIVASIINLETSETYGLMKIDQSVNELNKILYGMVPDDGEIILLHSNDSNIIYSNTQLSTAKKEAIQDIFLSENNITQTRRIDNENVLINKNVSTTHSWSIISMTPYSIIRSKSNFVQKITVSTLAITTAVIFIVSILLSTIIVSPLKKLSESFLLLKGGHFDTRLMVHGSDELAQINASFNDMASGMQTLIKEKYEANINRLQAELETLQSQINPHFLYNTLNSIKALADIEGMYDVSTMIKYLSDLFRYNLKNDVHVVHLSDEIDHLKKYLFLQQVRFSDKYKVEWSIDDLTMQCEMIRFVLQPIVENAIVHGFKDITKSGVLRISSYYENQKLIISISNNGNLLDSDSMQIINSKLEGDPVTQLHSKNSSIGIYNVNTRIKLYFGNEYGLKFELMDQFTIAKITLPINTNMKMKPLFNWFEVK